MYKLLVGCFRSSYPRFDFTRWDGSLEGGQARCTDTSRTSHIKLESGSKWKQVREFANCWQTRESRPLRLLFYLLGRPRSTRSLPIWKSSSNSHSAASCSMFGLNPAGFPASSQKMIFTESSNSCLLLSAAVECVRVFSVFQMLTANTVIQINTNIRRLMILSSFLRES